VIIPLVHQYGVQYLFAATILMGVFQVIAGLLRLNLLMQYVSRSVITGFVNALGIMIFLAQMPQLVHVPPATYAIIAVGLVIIYLFPRITRAIPSPLVAIVILTTVTIYGGIHVNTVGDMGKLPTDLPHFALPDVPFNLHTLRIILPYSLTMAAVGLLETMLTAQIVDDFTDTSSDKAREMRGQGIANFFTGFLGAMGGCAMIGQSVINVKSGGSTRLSTLVAGVFLLFLLVVLNPLVAR
ncbi:SulP family inorganic anion transporter, partial [Acidocella sp. MX-AZ02]|uniref:SulP family inorganic anion transporter n=1 Tax=Acidocella sp. MX-AZ02 TaxID=1214225 RepID=UPI00028E31F3